MKKLSMMSMHRITSIFVIFAMAMVLFVPQTAVRADGLSNVSDTLSTATKDVNSNHTIVFDTATGVANAETITLTFPSDFDLTGVTEDDIDIEEEGTDEETAADCTGADAVGVGIAGQVITFNFCTGDGGSIAAAATVTVKIGTGATHDGTGANQIDNASTSGSKEIEIGGTMTDSGSVAVALVDDDSVYITSTVDPSITFSIDDTTIGFGTLATANARFATGTTGSDTDSAAAHTMQVATNAGSGYVITYNGATLTDGGNTISVATITNDENGSAGTEQFAMGFSTSGDATIASGYDHNATPANRDWNYVASTTTTVVSELGPTDAETISAYYLANIAGTTQPGTYTTNVTYIATGTF
ncbi:MAG: hypothetical protein WC752_01225 [Patescibacteria group bacterium]|jgi:hypothetical protein